MFNIEFYSTIDGVSELWDFLDDLQKRAVSDKDISLKRRRRKLLVVKSIKRKKNATTGLPERGDMHGNLDRV